MAELLAHSGVDWLVLDMQHAPVGYAQLAHMLRAARSGSASLLVRVGGPSDQYGIQQALE